MKKATLAQIAKDYLALKRKYEYDVKDALSDIIEQELSDMFGEEEENILVDAESTLVEILEEKNDSINLKTLKPLLQNTLSLLHAKMVHVLYEHYRDHRKTKKRKKK